MSTRVVNKYKEKYDIYIGRGSKWGNDFSHKQGTLATQLVETREQAVDNYRDWILHGEGQYLLKDLHELKGKTLGCFCKPKVCHGDVLAELADKLA